MQTLCENETKLKMNTKRYLTRTETIKISIIIIYERVLER